jgi:hypothetical protein
MYYSWFNISAALNNNRFQITIPISTPVTATLTIPDGAYNISTLNDYLQYWFLQNGYYLQNPTNLQYFWFGNFVLSPSTYQVQFITTALPSSPASTDAGATPALNSYVGTGNTYSAATVNVGSGFSGKWPTVANQSMQLTVLSSNTFNTIIGFAPGTYPSVPTISGSTSTTSSTIVPNVNPIYAVQLRLSCVYNRFSANSTLLHTFTNQGQSIGNLIDASPKFYQPKFCIGSHRTLTLSMYDQNGNPLGLIDPNISLLLGFRKRSPGVNINA